MSTGTLKLDSAIVVPEEANDESNLFQRVYHDVGLPELMAYQALESARECWEEGLYIEDTFVESSLAEAIECLKRFQLAWRATVIAQRRIEESAQHVMKGDFASARKLLTEAEAMRKGYDPKLIQYTLQSLREGPNKIRELISESEESE